MRLIVFALLMLSLLSGCDRGKYVDVGPVLVDKKLIELED